MTIDRFIEFEGLRDGTFSLVGEESYFSWADCECCRDSLGGSRYDITARHTSGDILEYSVCPDCATELVYI